jgi:hypothetical protein
MFPTFAIVSPRGARIELGVSRRDDSPFILSDDTTGLGFVGREVQVTSSTGDGGRFRAVRTASRPVDLVVDVWGRTVADRDASVAAIAEAVRRVNGVPLPMLEATLTDGTVWLLPFVYEGGSDNLKRVPAGGPQTITFSLICPDPYWTARDATPFSIKGLASTGTFLPGLAEMHLTSSAASGVLYVDNAGQADAYPTWRLVGPTSRATVSLGDDVWTLGPIAAAEVVTVDTKTRTATLASGLNVYDRLGPAPRLFPIPTGRNELSVTMANATDATTATCFFRPRMEVIV